LRSERRMILTKQTTLHLKLVTSSPSNAQVVLTIKCCIVMLMVSMAIEVWPLFPERLGMWTAGNIGKLIILLEKRVNQSILTTLLF